MKYAITLNNQTIATADNFQAAYDIATDVAVIAFNANHVAENLDVELGSRLWVGSSSDNKDIHIIVADNSSYIEKLNQDFAQLGWSDTAEIAKEEESEKGFQAKKAEQEQVKEVTKKEAFKNFPHIQVGTLFASSWGFERTNVDFYQVIKRTEKTVTVRKIHQQFVSGTSGMSGYVVADKDNFASDETLTKRMTSWKKDGSEVSIKISSYATAYETTETEGHYTSWYY